LGFTPTTIPLPNPPINNQVIFNFNTNLSTGLNPAQTALIVAAIPPNGTGAFIPNGAPNITSMTEVVGTGAENLPFKQINITTATPGTITTITNTQVTITLQTGWQSPTDITPSGQTAAQVMAARQNLIRAQLNSQGVSNENINFAPDQYNIVGLPNGNQVTMETTTNSSTQQGNNNNQTITTDGYRYSQ
jgi:hypothetical protein